MRAALAAAVLLLCTAASCGPRGAGGATQHNVRVGERCIPEGAGGETSGGTALVCARAGDDLLRWRKA